MRRGSLGTRGALACAIVATLLSACGARALSPDGRDAGPPASVGSVGAPGVAGTAGYLAGQAGGAGTAGAAGTGTGAVGANGGTTGTAGAAGTGTGAVGANGGTTGAGGAADTPLRISGTEALRRIAAMLWNQQPDDDLVSQAAGGLLDTKSGREGVVRRMLGDPRATAGVGAFYRWWLDLDSLATLQKDPTLFPAYTPELQADMVKETETFAVNLTLQANATYTALMTSPSTFVNERLADLYGLSGITGDDLQPVSLDPSQRAGLLTQPALQVLGSFATRNSPSHRGTYIDERFLCMVIPAKPPAVPNLVPAAGMSLRAILSTNVANPTCQGCHTLIDQPGLAFEVFDAIGRWRTMDDGAPVDVSGLAFYNLFGNGASPTPFDGPIELATDLAMATPSRQCMARQWLAYVGNTTAAMIDDATLAPVYASFQASSFNLPALIVAVLTSDAFLAP
jgi:hypothetical protein